MNKIQEGRGKTLVLMENLSIEVNGLIHVSYDLNFFLAVDYYYEPELRPLEDDPGCPEFFEVRSVRTLNPMYFSNEGGVTLSIDSRAELLNILTDEQLTLVESNLRKQARGYANPFKYVDNDTLRPPISERIKTQLGFGLLKETEGER